MNVSGVAFDLDGTLVDSMELFPDVYVNTVRLRGGPNVRPHDIVSAFHIGSTVDLLSHFHGRATSDDDLECFYDLAAKQARAVRVFGGIPQLLSTLRAQGVPLGLFTGAARRTTQLLLESCGLTDFFDAVVAGDEVSEPKPCAEGLLRVCDELGVAPSVVAYVGDSQVDVDCALSAGCIAVVAGWGCDPNTIVGAAAVALAPEDIVELAPPAAHRLGSTSELRPSTADDA